MVHAFIVSESSDDDNVTVGTCYTYYSGFDR